MPYKVCLFREGCAGKTASILYLIRLPAPTRFLQGRLEIVLGGLAILEYHPYTAMTKDLHDRGPQWTRIQ